MNQGHEAINPQAFNPQAINPVTSFARALPKNHAIVQILADDGERIISSVRLDPNGCSSIIIGRHLDCDIVLDDPYVAARHCQIEFDPMGQLHLTDLGTVNGIRLDDQRVARAMLDPLTPQTLTLGRSTLKLRLRDHPLAPERPLSQQTESASPAPTAEPGLTRPPAWLFCLLALAFVIQAGTEAWFASFDHKNIVHEMSASILLDLAYAGVWTGAWALLSRLVIGSPRWTLHACIAMGGYLLGWCTYNLVGVGAFAANVMLSWILVTVVVQTLCSFAVMFCHLRAATRMGRASTIACAAVLPMAVLALTLTKHYSTEEGTENTEISSTYLLPPVFRLREPADVGLFLQDARHLKARVSQD